MSRYGPSDLAAVTWSCLRATRLSRPRNGGHRTARDPQQGAPRSLIPVQPVPLKAREPRLTDSCLVVHCEMGQGGRGSHHFVERSTAQEVHVSRASPTPSSPSQARVAVADPLCNYSQRATVTLASSSILAPAVRTSRPTSPNTQPYPMARPTAPTSKREVFLGRKMPVRHRNSYPRRASSR